MTDAKTTLCLTATVVKVTAKLEPYHQEAAIAVATQLYRAFPWLATEQGMHYWHEVYKNLLNLRPAKEDSEIKMLEKSS